MAKVKMILNPKNWKKVKRLLTELGKIMISSW